MTTYSDPFFIDRFMDAQAGNYNRILAELKGGRKRTHWMWFIFPQIDGLGYTRTSEFYAIKSIVEAKRYLDHPILETRLTECTEAVLAIEGRGISEIFDYPDDLKFRSCMTLFASVTGPESVFAGALAKYFDGEPDHRTLEWLSNLKGEQAT